MYHIKPTMISMANGSSSCTQLSSCRFKGDSELINHTFFEVVYLFLYGWVLFQALAKVTWSEIASRFTELLITEHWHRIFSSTNLASVPSCTEAFLNKLGVCVLRFVFLAKRPLHRFIEAETNGRHFADDIFKCIFLNENVLIPIKISMKFVPKSSIENIPAMVQIMAWRRPGDKPLFEPMTVNLPTHICVTRPQWDI